MINDGEMVYIWLFKSPGKAHHYDDLWDFMKI
jgi:hypothetical protein